MQDSWFWRAAACVGLVAALGYVVSQFTSARPVEAQGGRIVAVAERESDIPRLYLIDTQRSVILVYGGASRNRFTLLASRYFDIDAQATVGNEFIFRSSGYPINHMRKYVKK